MALNPLGLAPLAVVLGVLGVVAYAQVDEAFDRRLTRVARRLFGRYVRESVERRETLEAAYMGETYRGYAARTFLYTGLAALAGAAAGAYLVGGFLLVLPALIELLMGLPSTMVAILGIRGFELVLTPQQTLYILVGSGVAGGVVTAALTYTLRWELPKSDAEVRRRNIDEGMARTIAFMYALSRGGMAFPDVLRTLGRNDEIYGDSARELNVAVRQMDVFGRDMVTAMQEMTRRTPSETFKTFGENLTSVLQSGQSLSTFLHEQYERHQEDAADRQADLLEQLATIAEAYVTIFVAGVLFLITILLVFGLTTTDTLWILQLLGYLGIPLANVGFMIYLAQQLDALGIGAGGTTAVLDDYETTTHGRPDAKRQRQGLADGGVVAGDSANALRLAFYDRLKWVKRTLRDPLQELLMNPQYALYFVVPLALGAFLVRAPAAFQTATVNLRLLDDFAVQSLLLTLGSYAAVRYAYRRRIDAIEEATPDLLERLASLNEAGMTIVESFRRVRGSDVGTLTPEVERIWADISMGANVDDALVRFGRRIRTVPVTRVVVLLTNAMYASGELGRVLRIAATQARSDLKLRKRRQQQMLTYLVVIYISFLVFLVIIVAVQEVLVPSLPSSVPTPDASNRLGVGVSQFARLGQVDKAAYTLVFFHIALIQAVCTGFIGGQLGEGTLRDGAKHAAILLGGAYLAFVLLSSPVASMTLADEPVDGNQITLDSVSVSSGGYVVVHRIDTEGEVIGTSGYLAPGTHSDVTIDLQTTPSTRDELVLVVHRETTGNQQLDHAFDGTGDGVDPPYAASGTDDVVKIELTVK